MSVLLAYDNNPNKVGFSVKGKTFPVLFRGYDINHIPDPVLDSDDKNYYIEFRSYKPGFCSIDWGDGEVEQIPFTQIQDNTYVVVIRSLNIEYLKNPDVHPWFYYKKNGDEYIPHPPHVYKDGEIKERFISISFTNEIYRAYGRLFAFSSFPSLDAPALADFSYTTCQFGEINDIPFDKIGRSVNMVSFNIGDIKGTKFKDFPEGLLKLTKLKTLGINGCFDFSDFPNNNLRSVSVFKNLQSTNMNGNYIPVYVREFNELSNLQGLDIASDVNTYPDMSEVEYINKKLNNFNFLSYGGGSGLTSWKNDLVSGKGLQNILSLYARGCTNLPYDNLPYYLKEMRKLTSIDLSRVFFSKDKIDLFVNTFYDYVLSWDSITMSSLAIDGDRNQFYGLRLICYMADTPSGIQRPSGVLQAPAGFVLGSSNGTPQTPMEKIYVLSQNYKQIWNIAPEISFYNNTSYRYEIIIKDNELVFSDFGTITSYPKFGFNTQDEAIDICLDNGIDSSYVFDFFNSLKE